MPPHPLPLPSGERGRVRGKFQIYVVGIIANIIFEDHELFLKLVVP